MNGPAEQVLRRVLADAAAGVDVQATALVEIREKIVARRARRWQRITRRGAFLISTAGVGLAAVAAAIAVLVSIGVPPQTSSAPVPGAAPASLPPGIALLPVYYLGRSPTGPVLYREFHTLPAGDGSAAQRGRSALIAMLDSGSAYDHDYFSGWPGGVRVRAVAVDADLVTVDLTAVGAGSGDPVSSRLALQQLVWTVTAAVPGATGVRVLVDSAPVDTLWGQVPAGGVLHRGNALDLLAPVWLIDPQSGTELGPTFTVRVAGIVFEGSVQVRVRDSAGVVVRQSSVQLDRGAPAQGEAKLSLTLPPGRYTVQAYTLSIRDGSEQALDSHPVTIR